MADIDVINVGGTDYNVKDATARADSNAAVTLLAYKETGNTASQAYSVIGTPINWKGTLYYTKTAVAKNATWAVGTNLVAATNLGKLMSNIKTYVNGNGELVFRDLTGADTVLPFSGSNEIVPEGKMLKYYATSASLENIPTAESSAYDVWPSSIIANIKGKTTFHNQRRDGSSTASTVYVSLMKEDGTITTKSSSTNYTWKTLDISGYLYMMIDDNATSGEHQKWYVD